MTRYTYKVLYDKYQELRKKVDQLSKDNDYYYYECKRREETIKALKREILEDRALLKVRIDTIVRKIKEGE